MTGLRMRSLVARMLAAALLAGGLVGCSAGSDLSEDAAARLHEGVAAVVSAAEAGRYEEALAAAAVVRTQLARAADAGEVSVARYRLVDDALTRTEAELAVALAASAQPRPDATGEDAVREESAGEEPATPAPEESAEGADESPGGGRGNGQGDDGGKDQGDDRGNGRGNGGGNGRGNG